MRGSALAVVLILAACSSSVAPKAQSSPSGLSSPVATALHGDLPVQDLPADQEFHGGFLHLPDGAFVRDSKADIVVADAGTSLRRSTAQPYLFGSRFGDETSGAITYDRSAGRWLPVARSQMSPDGLRYAYTEWILSGTGALGPSPIGGRIHVVDVTSGLDRVTYSFDGEAYYGIVSFAQEGIYFSPGCVWGTAGSQCGPQALTLWRLDATTGTVTKVSDRRGSWMVAGGVAWTVPLAGVPDQPNQLLRIELSTGSAEVWDSEPIVSHQAGTCCWTMRFAGTDGDGAPLVVLPGESESQLLRVTGPGHNERIFSGSRCCSAAITDQNGTWFATDQGIYLYAKSTGVSKISDFSGVPAGTTG